MPILQIVVDAYRIDVADDDHFKFGDEDYFTVSVYHRSKSEQEEDAVANQHLLKRARDIVGKCSCYCT